MLCVNKYFRHKDKKMYVNDKDYLAPEQCVQVKEKDFQKYLDSIYFLTNNTDYRGNETGISSTDKEQNTCWKTSVTF